MNHYIILNLIIILNVICSLAGLTGKWIVIVVNRYLPSKVTIFLLYILVFVFGFGLVFFEEGWIVSTCIGFIEVGLGGGFSMCYYITSEYFPPLFLGFAFSVSQFCSRGSSILSYLLTDLKPPIPMILLCITTGVALFSILFLIKPKFT